MGWGKNEGEGKMKKSVLMVFVLLSIVVFDIFGQNNEPISIEWVGHFGHWHNFSEWNNIKKNERNFLGGMWVNLFKSNIFGSNEIGDFFYADKISKYVAYGEGGKMTYSSNGEKWMAVSSNVFGNSTIHGIFQSFDNIIIAYGENGKMAYSSDFITWAAVPSNIFGNSTIEGIFYDHGFFAHGKNGILAYSSDGIRWIGVSGNIFGSNTIKRICYGNDGIYVAGGGNTIAYSTDGINWTTITKSLDFKVFDT